MPDKYSVDKLNGQAPSVDEMRAILKADGYKSVYEWSDGPGAYYPEHHHQTHQSHWVISGEIELTVAGVGAVVLRPGDRDHMPAGTRHSARVVGDGPVRYVIGER